MTYCGLDTCAGYIIPWYDLLLSLSLLPPTVVASLLTMGCLWNRRRPSDIVLANQLADTPSSSPSSASPPVSALQSCSFLFMPSVPSHAHLLRRSPQYAIKTATQQLDPFLRLRAGRSTRAQNL